jgi:hypothetical protein
MTTTYPAPTTETAPRNCPGRRCVLRSDLEVADLIGLLAGASRVVEYAGSDAAARTRVLTVILDGLRPMS